MTSHSRCAKDSPSCDTSDYGGRYSECLFSSKIGTKSLKDGIQDICEAKKSNLRPVAGF